MAAAIGFFVARGCVVGVEGCELGLALLGLCTGVTGGFSNRKGGIKPGNFEPISILQI
jgi:hypothetical protein